MKNEQKKILLQFGLIFLSFLLFLLFFLAMIHRYVYQTRAQDNSLVLKLKLQGERMPKAQAITSITLYSNTGDDHIFNDVELIYQQDRFFEGKVNLGPEFDFTKTYAIFIKPQKYVGQLFCETDKVGSNCTVPAFVFKPGENQVDLSPAIFYSGDLEPQDGKVDSYDISKIIAELISGQENSVANINNDTIVNGVDYSLALYTLSKNKEDDEIPFTKIVPQGGIPVGTFNLTPTLSATSAPTPLFDSADPTNTPIPQAQTNNKGRCQINVSGQVYINITDEPNCVVYERPEEYWCVSNKDECMSQSCLPKIRATLADEIKECFAGLATLNQEATALKCETEYIQDPNCAEPTPAPLDCGYDLMPECK